MGIKASLSNTKGPKNRSLQNMLVLLKLSIWILEAKINHELSELKTWHTIPFRVQKSYANSAISLLVADCIRVV